MVRPYPKGPARKKAAHRQVSGKSQVGPTHWLTCEGSHRQPEEELEGEEVNKDKEVSKGVSETSEMWFRFAVSLLWRDVVGVTWAVDKVPGAVCWVGP